MTTIALNNSDPVVQQQSAATNRIAAAAVQQQPAATNRIATATVQQQSVATNRIAATTVVAKPVLAAPTNKLVSLSGGKPVATAVVSGGKPLATAVVSTAANNKIYIANNPAVVQGCDYVLFI